MHSSKCSNMIRQQISRTVHFIQLVSGYFLFLPYVFLLPPCISLSYPLSNGFSHITMFSDLGIRTLFIHQHAKLSISKRQIPILLLIFYFNVVPRRDIQEKHFYPLAKNMIHSYVNVFCYCVRTSSFASLKFRNLQ